MEYKVPAIVKEYASALNDDEIKYLSMRLEQKFGNDVAEALLMMQQHEGMDAWLRSARSHEEFFELLDIVSQQFENEIEDRLN